MTVVNTRNTDKTLVTYFGDGVTKTWAVPFDYLHRDFIKVTVDGVDVPFVWLNKTTVETPMPPPSGTFLVIRRWTDAKRRLVNFKDGSILRARDLDLNALQSLHIAEEARDSLADAISLNGDGEWEARHRRIVNVAWPAKEKDVVTVEWAHSVYGGNLSACFAARDRAEAARDRAEAARDRSVSAETRSVAAEVRATEVEAYLNSQVPIIAQAGPSATTAIAQAERATAQADRAELAANSVDFPLALGRAVHHVNEEVGRVAWKHAVAVGKGKGLELLNNACTAVLWTFRPNTEDMLLVDKNGAGAFGINQAGNGWFRGNVQVDGHIKSAGGSVYAGEAVLSGDGNVNGTIWGGWLSTWLTNKGVHLWRPDGGRYNNEAGFTVDGMVELVRRGHIAYGWHISSDNRLYLGQTNGQGGHLATVVSYRNGGVYVSGELEASGNVIAFSDIRQKRGVKTTPGLSAVRKLRGVSWSWKKGHPNAGKKGAGLIAQDVAKVLPEAISRSQDGYLGVNYNAVVGLLVNAVKELAGTVKDLQERISTLEGKHAGAV